MTTLCCHMLQRAATFAPFLLIVGFAITACQGDDSRRSQTPETAQICAVVDYIPASDPSSTFDVELRDLDDPNRVETIVIPDGRPIYALLVSGFHQNRNLDMFHFYNFAKSLLENGAYVHYSWWNNLLAPYMERPLHNDASVPSTGPIPYGDILSPPVFPPINAKAVPNDDYQFQHDALTLLTAIREHNPHAAIILVGHSMGGDAVARLANLADNADIDIALLAPIDPVGNRSCIFNPDPLFGPQFCSGVFNFTRWRATHLEILDTPGDWVLFNPPRRSFSANINYLYHRWQQEGLPPFDFSCPGGGSSLIPCASFKPDSEYLFEHPGQLMLSIYGGSTNVQSEVATSLLSGLEIYPPPSVYNSGGWIDGHGEIVGFRGVVPLSLDAESYPMALGAQGDWPSGLAEDDKNDRVTHMQAWEADPDYLRDNGFEPLSPDLCKVSGDMSEILRTAVNLQPVADAGPDQIVMCSGLTTTTVTLDGSRSTDPNQDPLTFTWEGPFGTLMGESINPNLPLGEHSITLTVDDGRGKTGSDTVVVTLKDI